MMLKNTKFRALNFVVTLLCKKNISGIKMNNKQGAKAINQVLGDRLGLWGALLLHQSS